MWARVLEARAAGDEGAEAAAMAAYNAAKATADSAHRRSVREYWKGRGSSKSPIRHACVCALD